MMKFLGCGDETPDHQIRSSIQEAIRRGVYLQIVHMDQHYARTELIVDLGVGKGTQGYQKGEITLRLKKSLIGKHPDLNYILGEHIK